MILFTARAAHPIVPHASSYEDMAEAVALHNMGAAGALALVSLGGAGSSSRSLPLTHHPDPELTDLGRQRGVTLRV